MSLTNDSVAAGRVISCTPHQISDVMGSRRRATAGIGRNLKLERHPTSAQSSFKGLAKNQTT